MSLPDTSSPPTRRTRMPMPSRDGFVGHGQAQAAGLHDQAPPAPAGPGPAAKVAAEAQADAGRRQDGRQSQAEAACRCPSAHREQVSTGGSVQPEVDHHQSFATLATLLGHVEHGGGGHHDHRPGRRSRAGRGGRHRSHRSAAPTGSPGQPPRTPPAPRMLFQDRAARYSAGWRRWPQPFRVRAHAQLAAASAQLSRSAAASGSCADVGLSSWRGSEKSRWITSSAKWRSISTRRQRHVQHGLVLDQVLRRERRDLVAPGVGDQVLDGEVAMPLSCMWSATANANLRRTRSGGQVSARRW